MSSVVSDMPSGIDYADRFAGLIANLDLSGGLEPAYDTFARNVADFEQTAMSDATRYAIAVYCAVLAFSLCAAFYLEHPEAADLVLDPVTPATWSFMIGTFIYAHLSGGSGNADE